MISRLSHFPVTCRRIQSTLMSMSSSTTTGKTPLIWADQKTGEFNRQVSSFRSKVSGREPNAEFPAEAGRYHLYVSLACPWACRALMVRAMKGLEHVIGLSVVGHLLGENGWEFTENEPGVIPDSVNNVRYIRELYFKAEPKYSGRFTVPVLWDIKRQTIVNNESAEIIRMLNSEFNEFAKHPEIDLAPEHLLPEIDEVNQWIYDGFNNGVYKAGFATKQEAYEKNCRLVFETMDRIEERLQTRKYLVGERLTETDVRCFNTAIRFDPVYHGHFKCNLKTIKGDYPNILRWMREIYSVDGVKETVNMDHIKKHYYRSHIQINPNQIVGMNDGPL